MLLRGSKAPDFTLDNQNGESVKLSDFIGQKLLIWFFPKANTGGCTNEGQLFRDEYKNFRKKNTAVIGISADSIKTQKNFCVKQKFPFPLLSDPDKTIIEAYKAFGPKKFMGREYDGIYRISYLIDETGIIQKAYEKVKPKEHAYEVLSDIS